MNRDNSKDFKRIWSEGIISIDTSALLFLQECNTELAKYIMDTLLFAEERIWIAPQVAKHEMIENFGYAGSNEYGTIGRLNKFNKTLESSIKKVENVLKSISDNLREEGHELLAEVITSAKSNELFYSILSEFDTKTKETTDESRKFIQSGLVKIFQQEMCMKTSDIFNDEEISKIKNEGIRRYKYKIPPGYCDNVKNENEFGDLIVWKELLEKSKIANRPLIFITRDKKEDWFRIEEGRIVGIRSELFHEAKEYGVEIHVIYFNDFVSLSANLVSKDINNLISILESDDELLLQIEEYINDNMYEEIQDQLSSNANSDYNSDYTIIDTIESVNVRNLNYEVFDDYVAIECQVEFEASVDHNYHYDSREDDMELNGNMVAVVGARICIDILSGQHDENNKSLDIESTSIDFDELKVISSSNPFGDDEEEFDDEYFIDFCQDDEDNYYEDESF